MFEKCHFVYMCMADYSASTKKRRYFSKENPNFIVQRPISVCQCVHLLAAKNARTGKKFFTIQVAIVIQFSFHYFRFRINGPGCQKRQLRCFFAASNFDFLLPSRVLCALCGVPTILCTGWSCEICICEYNHVRRSK